TCSLGYFCRNRASRRSSVHRGSNNRRPPRPGYCPETLGYTLAPLSAGDAHVSGHRRLAVSAVDDEVMALGLAGDRLADRCMKKLIAFGRSERRSQIRCIFLAEAHVQHAGASEPHAVTAF